jgi:hypothetical protein
MTDLFVFFLRDEFFHINVQKIIAFKYALSVSFEKMNENSFCKPPFCSAYYSRGQSQHLRIINKGKR